MRFSLLQFLGTLEDFGYDLPLTYKGAETY